MKTARATGLAIASALVIAAFVVISAVRQRGRVLAIELEQERQLAKQHSDLARDNQRLQAEIESGPPLASLKMDRGRLMGREFNVDRDRFQEHALKHALAMPDDPVWLPSAAVVPTASLGDAGRSTPQATLETTLWAARGGDLDRLVSVLGLDPAATAFANGLFSRLGLQAQASYGDPLRLAAAWVTSQLPDDYAAYSTLPITSDDGPAAALLARVEQADGGQSNLVLRFEHSPDGWKLMVPEAVLRGATANLLNARAP